MPFCKAESFVHECTSQFGFERSSKDSRPGCNRVPNPSDRIIAKELNENVLDERQWKGRMIGDSDMHGISIK